MADANRKRAHALDDDGLVDEGGMDDTGLGLSARLAHKSAKHRGASSGRNVSGDPADPDRPMETEDEMGVARRWLAAQQRAVDGMLQAQQDWDEV